ncbi:probable RNA-binding protein 18 isoform X2 [Asparagus officinalis]|nr:probable RNA-binding protein 18 isoform X2 [Asparagus officinalis]
MADENCESRLYVGNLDHRITEAHVLRVFSPFGKIVSEDFLWHTRGPKRGEPRGYAFIEYSTKEEAQLAKTKMNGRLACGRPLVVRFASEKCSADAADPLKTSTDLKNLSSGSSTSGQVNRNAKIAAIKNKLKSLEEEGCSMKKPKLAESTFSKLGDHSERTKD